MTLRLLSRALLGLTLLTGAAASAQISAPHPLDIDIPSPEDDRPRPKKHPAAEQPAAEEDDQTLDEASKEEAFVPGRPHRPAPVAADAKAAPDAGMAADAGAVAAPGSSAAAPPSNSKEVERREAKAILMPPQDGAQQLMQAWRERQKALDLRNFKAVQDQESRLLALRAELGFDNLFALAGAMAHESQMLLASEPAEAVRRALIATQLAPDLPYAHWSLARAAFASDLTNFPRYFASAIDAVRATLREPRFRASVLADAGASALASLVAAGTALLALILLRHLRRFLHDFNDLFPAGTGRIQSALLALVAVMLPPALGLGLFWSYFAVALAAWLYMSWTERVLSAATLALLVVLPTVGGLLAVRSALPGSKAEVIYLASRGGLEGPRQEAELKRLADEPLPSYPVLFVLGQQARRRGDVEPAVALLRRAAEARPSYEAMLELGDALVLAGDLDGARETFQRASEREPTRAEPHLLLSRLASRKAQLVTKEEASSELARSQDAMRRAIELDPELIATSGAEPDMHANRLLVGATLPVEVVEDLAAAEISAGAIEGRLSVILFGAVPEGLVLPVGLLAVGLLGLLAVVGGSLAPAGSCSKCGRSVCRRCDDAAVGTLCGQCVFLFNQRAAVDPAARADKELSIERFARRRKLGLKGAAFMLSGAGQVLGGSTIFGALLLIAVFQLLSQAVVAGGLVRAPLGEVPPLLRLLPPLALGLLLHAWGIHRAFDHPAKAKEEEPKAPGRSAS